MTDYAELRAALKAGPTGGEWVVGASDLPVSHLSIHAVDGQRHSTIARMVKSEHRVWCAGEFVATWKFIAAANPDVIRALLAERDALRDALCWTAGALQASCVAGKVAEADTARALIGNETKSIGQILDAADAALAQGEA